LCITKIPSAFDGASAEDVEALPLFLSHRQVPA
jgi:hypothetical protein